VKKGTELVADLASVAETACKLADADGKLLTLPVPKGVAEFAETFAKWKDETPKGFSVKMLYVDMAFDVMDFIADSAKAYSVYSQIAANIEAYMEYITVIDFISQNGNDFKFIQTAAGEVMHVALNDGEFFDLFIPLLERKSVEMDVKLLITVGEAFLTQNPYGAAVLAALYVGDYLSGLSATTKAMLDIIIADSIFDGFVACMEGAISSRSGIYLSVISYDQTHAYMTQLYQSKIHAEITYLELCSIKSVSNWLANIIKPVFGQATSKQEYENVKEVIRLIVDSAEKATVELHPKLEAKLAVIFNESSSGSGGR